MVPGGISSEPLGGASRRMPASRDYSGQPLSYCLTVSGVLLACCVNIDEIFCSGDAAPLDIGVVEVTTNEPQAARRLDTFFERIDHTSEYIQI